VKFIDLLRLALARLAVSRVRALLTMLGVIIGVASVIALVAVGQGASSGITSRLQSLGTNLLTVTPGASVTGGTRGAGGSATTLTVADGDRHSGAAGDRGRGAGTLVAAGDRGRVAEHDD